MVGESLKRLLVLSIGLLLPCLGSIAIADEDPSQKGEVRQLQDRVSRLEAELESLRREVAAIKAALPRTAIKPPQNKLDIQVIEGNWSGAPPSNIRAVCLSAAQEIWRHLPDQTIDPITVRHSRQGPMVIYGTGREGERRVLLHVNGAYWAQFSFQFAHEFCHILCNYRAAKNPNLWFEESLCETASLFAMRRMAETWKTKPPYSNWKSYSASLAEYVEDRLQATEKLDGVTLAEWYQENKQALRNDGTDRAKNQIVAVALLELLEKNPHHWQAVTHLNQWDKSESLTLAAYLIDWYRRVPDKHKPFVADVGKLFEISLE